MRLASASIKALFHFSSARQQAKIDTTVTMARGSGGKGKTPRTETSSAPLQPSLTLTSSPSDVTMPSTDSKSVITSISDSQDAQGLVNPSLSDGGILSTQATEDRRVSAKSKKRNRRKAKNDKAQGQGPRTSAVSPDIFPLDYSGPMPAPTTSRRGSPITSPEPNVGSPSISRFLAFTEPTKAEENLRQENEKLKRELEEANSLTRGLKKAHLQLGEEVETWKQKCEGLSEVVKGLRSEVEGMINSRISKFVEKMEKEEVGKGKEAKEEVKEGEKEEEGMDKQAKKEEEKVGESKEKEGKEKKAKVEEGKENNRKEKERAEKVWNKHKGKGKEGKEEQEKTGVEDKDGKNGEAKEKEAELRARHEKSRQSSFEQIEAYRQREKKEERRRKRWWSRFYIKLVRSPLPKTTSPILKLCYNCFSKQTKNFKISTQKLTDQTLFFSNL